MPDRSRVTDRASPLHAVQATATPAHTSLRRLRTYNAILARKGDNNRDQGFQTIWKPFDKTNQHM